MTRTKLSVVVLAGFCLLAALVVSGAGQGTNKNQNVKPIKPPLVDYNVSGTIGWRSGTGWTDVTNKNCSDYRVVISEKTGTKKSGGMAVDQLKAIGYVYPTAIANSTDCSYRAKLPVNTPRYLSVERTGSTGNPISYPEGWQNPITVKSGEKLTRDFKMGIPLIH